MLGCDRITDPPDSRIEAKVDHLVGLIKDEVLDGIKIKHTLGEEVFKPPRGGNNNINALFERIDLARIPFTTADHHITNGHAAAEIPDAGGDLMRQLTRRGQDQCLCTARTRTAVFGDAL